METNTLDQAWAEDLTQIALKAGAGDAKIISTDQVIVDPRVRLKCLVPPCALSGICRFCPPHGFSPQQTQKRVDRYQNALFFHVEVDSDVICRSEVGDAVREYRADDKGRLLIVGAHQLLVFQIVALVEKRARQLGCKPAGYVAAACKELLCFLHDDCPVLAKKKPCRHPDLARPAMEASGMDVFRMATSVGWDIYPIGRSLDHEDVPRGILLGMILIN